MTMISSGSGQPWCAQHNGHPKDCWEIHNPKAEEVTGTLTAEEHNMLLQIKHSMMQRTNDAVRNREA